jgi:aryl-alcohol dehydrogenase-like predicted oxidoreductase
MRYLEADTAKRISKIGLGTWHFGSTAWGYGDAYAAETAHAIVRRALELGITLFDTAEIYNSGRSERILGRALGDDSESVVIADKIFPLAPFASLVRHRAKASVRRLGVSRLDLYQVHYPHPLVGDHAIMRGMRSLRRDGLVGEVGVSNYSVARWQSAERALRGRILTNQVPYNLVDRLPERDLVPFAQAHGRVIIAFSPLAQGLLSGRYDVASRPADQIRATSPYFRPEHIERIQPLFAVLREVADAHAATPAQIALAWVIHRPAVAAIPGAASLKQLESNAAAADITLADDEHRALDAASAAVEGVVDPARSPLSPVSLRSPGALSRRAHELRHCASGGLAVARTARADTRRRAAR